LFQEALLFQKAIAFYYNKQIAIQFFGQVHLLLLDIFLKQLLICLFKIVIVCVLNQYSGHLLLSDVLNSTISISLKMRDKVEISPTLNNLMDDDYGIAFELFLLASNIKKQVYGVQNYSFHLKINLKT
jgi:hypothetical protein